MLGCCFMVVIFQGAVEAKGSFTELQDSGLSFAKHLCSELENVNSMTTEEVKGSIIHEGQEQPLHRTTTQNIYQVCKVHFAVIFNM